MQAAMAFNDVNPLVLRVAPDRDYASKERVIHINVIQVMVPIVARIRCPRLKPIFVFRYLAGWKEYKPVWRYSAQRFF
jgi:hypothetical protein